MSGLDVAAGLLLADAGLVLLTSGHLRLLLGLQGALLLLAALAAPATPALALTLVALLLGPLFLIPVIIIPWRCGAFPSVQPRRPAHLALLAAAVLGASLAANRVLPNDPGLAAALLASLTAGIGGAAFTTGTLQAACLATAQNAALLGVLALTPPGPLPALALLAAATIVLLVPPGRTPA